MLAMSVMAETPPRPLECLSDSDMNIDTTSTAGIAAASSQTMTKDTSSNKRKNAPSSSPMQSAQRGIDANIYNGDAKETAESSKNHVSGTPAAKKLKAAGATPSRDQASPSNRTNALVQLKNGKLSLKQKAVEWSRSMSALQAIIAFNQWLDDEVEQILEAIPQTHLNMIAMLAQESDKSLPDLAKHIKNVVIPAADEDGVSDDEGEKVDKLPLNVLTAAIESLASRVNYGIKTIPSSSTTEVSVPAGLQIWRWEVRDLDLLAQESREKIVARREERQRAQDEASNLLASLPEDERKSLLSKGRKIKPTVIKSDESASETKRAPAQEMSETQAMSSTIGVDDDDVFMTPPRPKAQAHMTSVETEEAPQLAPSVSPSKSSSSRESPRPSSKPVSPEQETRDAEKEARRREREAKKAEKARKEVEKEARKLKAEQAQKRAASFMSSFMQRPRSTSPTKADGGAPQSDFDRAFPPCNYKDMAPINRFARKLDADAFKAWQSSVSTSECLAQMKKQDSNRRSSRKSRKGIHPSTSIRECMRRITEAGVMGDEDEGRQALVSLADRKSIPVKLLHFHTDRRPAWFGTWTRSTNFIGARRPLGQDPVALDYNYDSDAEWEEVDPFDGEDVQDNEKDEDENDSQGRSDSDSEMDDWLVDDLEVEEEDEQDHPALKDPTIVGFGPPLPGTEGVNQLQPKKKAKKYKPIGRRFETKLVKFETGPHWEEELGVATYDAFRDYQMEMLNGASTGVDPFAFTSEEPVQAPVAQEIAATQALVGDDSTTKTTALASKENAAIVQSTLDRARGFPESNLPSLLSSIEGSTAIRSVLVDELKQKFAHLGKGATKANIEACLGVYTEPKSKKAGSKWSIKSEYRSLAGL